MVNFIQFTPISGDLSDKPVCSLLEIDNAKILLDCGWEHPFDPEDLNHLKKYAKEIDCVLLTHGTLRHCGALPYAYNVLGLTCPIYATFPVQIMGKFTLLEALANLKRSSSFSLFQSKDIYRTFNKISLLKYSQPLTLSGKAQDIVITAYVAGHTVGGTFWKIKKNTEEILYAMDLHHRKERHLSPSHLFSTSSGSPFLRPSALIVGCRYSNPVPAKTRDALFLDPILSTLQQGGDVLVPVDTACRLLELAYILDSTWQLQGLVYPIFCLSHLGQEKVFRAAAGMLEWFSDTLTQTFSITRTSPFDFKTLTFTTHLETILNHRGPKLILATDTSMDWGPSRDVFLHLHTHPQHRIVLPFMVPTSSLAYKLSSLYNSLPSTASTTTTTTTTTSSSSTSSFAFEWTYSIRMPLTGEKLDQFLKANESQVETSKQALMLRLQNQSILEAELTDEEELEPESTTSQPILFQGYDAFVYSSPKTLFPYTEHRRRFDDYGEAIVHEDYITEADRLERKATQLQQHQKEKVIRLGLEKDEGEEENGMHHENEKEGGSGEGNWKLGGRERFNELEMMDEEAGVGAGEGPFEYVPVTTTFQVHCAITVVDMNGLFDERSFLAMVTHVHPKKLIFMSRPTTITTTTTTTTTTPLNTNATFSSFMTDNSLSSMETYLPSLGERFNLSSSKNVQQVKLTDALSTSIEMQKYGNYELGWVQATVSSKDVSVPSLDLAFPSTTLSSSNSSTLTTPLSTPTPTPTSPSSLSRFSSFSLTTTPSTSSLVIGQLKLSEFKSVLDQAGLDAKFIQGVLVVNDKIGIYKQSDGGLLLEGKICKEYFQVRQLLYRQHVMF